jgi:hypothetical protein
MNTKRTFTIDLGLSCVRFGDVGFLKSMLESEPKTPNRTFQRKKPIFNEGKLAREFPILSVTLEMAEKIIELKVHPRAKAKKLFRFVLLRLQMTDDAEICFIFRLPRLVSLTFLLLEL